MRKNYPLVFGREKHSWSSSQDFEAAPNSVGAASRVLG